MMSQDDSNKIRKSTDRDTGRPSASVDEARRDESPARDIVVPIGRARRPVEPEAPTPPDDDDPGPQAA